MLIGPAAVRPGRACVTAPPAAGPPEYGSMPWPARGGHRDYWLV